MSRYLLSILLTLLLATPAVADTITCLERIEPLHGVRVLAGPSESGAASVISEVRVKEGDWVEQGQVLAVLDDQGLRQAEINRIAAELGLHT